MSGDGYAEADHFISGYVGKSQKEIRGMKQKFLIFFVLLNFMAAGWSGMAFAVAAEDSEQVQTGEIMAEETSAEEVGEETISEEALSDEMVTEETGIDETVTEESATEENAPEELTEYEAQPEELSHDVGEDQEQQ